MSRARAAAPARGAALLLLLAVPLLLTLAGSTQPPPPARAASPHAEQQGAAKMARTDGRAFNHGSANQVHRTAAQRLMWAARLEEVEKWPSA